MSKGMISPMLVTPDVDAGGVDPRVDSIINGQYESSLLRSKSNVDNRNYQNGKNKVEPSDAVRRLSASGSKSLPTTSIKNSRTDRNPSGTESRKMSLSKKDTEHGSHGKSILSLGLIFLVSLLLIFYVYSTFPRLDAGEREYFRLPRNIEDAKKLGSILNRYKERYYAEVLSGVFVVYLFLQTFAIPGSIFLSILSGFLFPFWTALLLICFCSATGASFCYGLSFLVGRPLINKYFPDRVQQWSETVNRHRDNLLNYIIFLRITPFLPNWFINITSPVIGVPLFPFWLGTFIGVAAPSFVAIQAGTTLNQLTSSADALTWTSLIVLVVLGVFSLIPVVLKDILRKKFD